MQDPGVGSLQADSVISSEDGAFEAHGCIPVPTLCHILHTKSISIGSCAKIICKYEHMPNSSCCILPTPALCVQVLVATSTLAWGVNTPAHLVVIKVGARQAVLVVKYFV